MIATLTSPCIQVVEYTTSDIIKLIRGLRRMSLDHDRPRSERRHSLLASLGALLGPHSGASDQYDLEFADSEDQRIVNDALALV